MAASSAPRPEKRQMGNDVPCHAEQQTRNEQTGQCSKLPQPITELNLLNLDKEHTDCEISHLQPESVPDLNLSLALSGLEKHFLDLNFEPKDDSPIHAYPTTVYLSPTHNAQNPLPTSSTTELHPPSFGTEGL